MPGAMPAMRMGKRQMSMGKDIKYLIEKSGG